MIATPTKVSAAYQALTNRSFSSGSSGWTYDSFTFSGGNAYLDNSDVGYITQGGWNIPTEDVISIGVTCYNDGICGDPPGPCNVEKVIIKVFYDDATSDQYTDNPGGKGLQSHYIDDSDLDSGKDVTDIRFYLYLYSSSDDENNYFTVTSFLYDFSCDPYC